MTQHRFTGDHRLIFQTHFGKQIRNLRYPGIHPFHESREIGRFINLLRCVALTGSLVIFGQQVNNTASLVFIDHGRNSIRNQSAPDVFIGQFKTVGQVGHQQGKEAAQLLRSGKRSLKLILKNRKLVKIDRRAIEIRLQHVRLFDRPGINLLSVTGGRGLRYVKQCRPFIGRIIRPIAVSNGQFTQHITPAESIHHQTGHFSGIRTNRENRPGQDIADRVHNSVTVRTQCDLRDRSETAGIGRGQNRLAGCLFDNAGQNG